MIKRDTFILRNGEVLFLRTNDFKAYVYAFYKPNAKNIIDYDLTGLTFYESQNPLGVAQCISLLNRIDSKIVKHFDGDSRQKVLSFTES